MLGAVGEGRGSCERILRVSLPKQDDKYPSGFIRISVCVCMDMYVCASTCMCVCIYIYTHTYANVLCHIPTTIVSLLVASA